MAVRAKTKTVATTADAEAAPTEDRQLFRALGRALWRMELPTGMSVEERKSSWVDGRRKYMQQARKLRKFMDTEGVSILSK